ncbi:T9SS type A sorting domain-containing protein [Hyphobacterium sp. CCMP332]|nr:T9SS type A sorting domain-containing protein [Hyphobacterium sp. CCMP332]
MRTTILFFITAFVSFFELNAQNESLTFFKLSDFKSNILLGEMDDYGNGYYLVNHVGTLNFLNDSVENSNSPFAATTLCKIRPDGFLYWHKQITGIAGPNGVKILDDGIIIFGLFRDTVTWDGLQIIESFEINYPIDDQFLAKFSFDGDIQFLNPFYGSIKSIDHVVKINNEAIIVAEFDSLAILGNDTLFENINSQMGNHSDEFITKIDSDGNYQWAIALGSSSFEVINDMTYDPVNNSILMWGYFQGVPEIAPSIPAGNLVFLEFDTSGNLTNSRTFDIPLTPPFISFGYNSKGELLIREYNDSSENLFPATTIYNGLEYLGFYNYSFGGFAPPTSGIAYGANSIASSSDKLIYDGDLFSGFYNHPQGMIIDNNQPISMPYSITCFDSDSMKFIWNLGTNTQLKETDLNQGVQLLYNQLIDSVTILDTANIVKTPSQDEFLLVYINDCDYFKPQVSAQLINDSIFLDTDVLEVKWYRNNSIIPNLNDNRIRLTGSGNYYAVVNNYFGCEYATNTLNVVSEILNKETDIFLNVYPNPSKGVIHFDLSSLNPKEELQLQIININGRTVFKTTITDKFSTLDISSLPSGIYIYNLKSENYRFRGKILKE